MYYFRTTDPVTGNQLTIDSHADDLPTALKSIQKCVRRYNSDRAKRGIPEMPAPRSIWQLGIELPRDDRAAA